MTERQNAQKISNLCGMCGIPCGIPCGIKSLIHKGCAVCAVSTAYLPMCARVQARAGAHPCAHPQAPTHTAHTAHTAHALRIKHLRAPAYRTPNRTYRTPTRAPSHCPLFASEKKEEMKRTIVCTPENAPEFRALARRWPELGQLINELKAQDLFPGLRAARITLEGDEKQLAKGLAGVCPENAPEGQKSEGCAK